MVEQDNNKRITRATAKKRAIAAASNYNLRSSKKRVALRELTNFKNALIISKSDLGEPLKLNDPQLKKKNNKKEENKFVEIDAVSNDPQFCAAHYASDIFDYLRSIENRTRPMADYMTKIQHDINPNMRAILVDWLVEVVDEYKFVSDTLYLSISYLDRFLSLNVVHRRKLQLLGISCFLIAAKYEVSKPPKIEDLCTLTKNSCSKEEMIKMEGEILECLNFEIGSPTIKTFLRRFIAVAQEDSKYLDLEFEFLGCYISELSLLDYGCIRFLPSLIAASVVFLAKFGIKPEIHPWNSTLSTFTGYKPSDLKDCALEIHQFYLKNHPWLSIRDKYKQEKFKEVATMVSPSQIPQIYFEDGVEGGK